MNVNCMVLASLGLFSALLAPAAPGAADQPVRVAIVAGDGERAPKAGVVELLAVGMSKQPGVVLLEREEVQRILAEQKLSASGLVGIDSAVRLGKVLSADLFVFVEKIPAAKPPELRIRIVEGRTGIVFEAMIEKEDGSADCLKDFATSLQRILVKVRTEPKNRRYVGILGVSVERRGVDLDGLAEALTMFLATDLNASDAVIMLDREHLERLADEKALAGVLLDLKTSTWLIEGQLRPLPNEAACTLDLLVRSPGGSAAEPVRVRFPSDALQENRAKIAALVVERLSVAPLRLELPTLEQEAAQFLNRAQVLARFGEPRQSLRALECAYALHATDDCREALAAGLNAEGCGVIGRQNRTDMTDSEKGRALALFLRANRLALESVTHRIKGAGPAPDGGKRGTGFPTFRNYSARWPDLRSGDAQLSAMHAELKQVMRDLFAAKTDYHARNWARCADAWFHTLWDASCDLGVLADNGVEVARVLRGFLSAISSPPGPLSDAVREVVLNAFDCRLRDPAFERYLDPAGVDALFELCRWIQKQPSAHVRIAGCFYELRIAEKRAPERCPEIARRYWTELIRWIGDEGYGSQTTGLVMDNGRVFFPWFDAMAVSNLLLQEMDSRTFVSWYNDLNRKWLPYLGESPREQRLNWLRKAREKLPPDHLASYRHEFVQAAIVSARNDMEKRIAELEERPQATVVPDDWKDFSFQSLQPGARPAGNCKLAAMRRVGDQILYVWSQVLGDKGDIEFHAVWTALDLGHPRPTAVLRVPAGAAPFSAYRHGVTDVDADNSRVFLGTHGGGVLILEPNKAETWNKERGLPDNNVRSLAQFRGSLYVGFESDYFCRLDLATHKLTELAYGRSLVKRNSLDAGPFVVQAILPDKSGEFLWLAAQADMRGMWRYYPETGVFTNVALNPSPFCPVLSWHDGSILSGSDDYLGLMDPERRTWKPLQTFGAGENGLWPCLVMRDQLITAGRTVTGGTVTDGKHTYSFHADGGLYLHTPYNGQAAWLAKTPDGKKLMIDYAVTVSEDEAILASGEGEFWQMKRVSTSSAERDTLLEARRKEDAFRLTQTNRVAIAGVSASSFTPDAAVKSVTNRFGPRQATDNNEHTCWASSHKEAVGAWVEVEFAEESRISSVMFMNGWIPSEKDRPLYLNNHRVKGVVVRTDKGESTTLTLTDGSDPQYLIPMFKQKARGVRLTISEIYPAEVSDKKDPPWVNFSEVAFFGGNAP